jgi:hypothetical protein
LKSHLPGLIKNGILLEIHVKLFEPSGNTMTEELLNRSANRAGESESLFNPEPQLHFLFLVKHLIRHEETGAFQVKFYTDLYLLLFIYPEEILNISLLNLAEKAYMKDALLEKLVTLEMFWGISLPEFIRSAASDLNISVLAEKFTRFFRYPESSKADSDQGKGLKPLYDIPGVFNKILFIVGYIFPSREYVKYKYNIKTAFGVLMYYPGRWWKTVRRILE